MQKITKLITMLMLLATIPVTAQEVVLRRGNCTPDVSYEQVADGRHFAPPRKLSPKTDWDAERTYPVAVILVQFSNVAFSQPEAHDFYHRIFNEDGFNGSKGPGCVAEYFRTQSEGMFNPRFDVYGPVYMDVANNTKNDYGASIFRDAAVKVADSLSVDFTPYDWDNDGMAEPIIFIYSGPGGNENATSGKGYVWPNTSYFSTIYLDNNIRLSAYSASAETWSTGKLCGIGTICHEFSHTLGLPDFYPTDGSEYSVVDEWDLMDGGNFTNAGWCPPNYSIHEKMLMGWLQPEELTEPCTISNLKPVAEGGKAYMIRTENADEFYLLENRQWKGWDLRAPGHGLVITHVNYNSSLWALNAVNTNPNHHNYEMVHADNMDYNLWIDSIGKESPYSGGHSRILSTSPYPYVTEEVENRELTDTSVPAATIYNGTGLLGKPITGITENSDGTITFQYCSTLDGIAAKRVATKASKHVKADILGRIGGSTGHTIVIDSDGRKTLQIKNAK